MISLPVEIVEDKEDIESILDSLWNEIYVDEIHQDNTYRYTLRLDKKEDILKKIKNKFSTIPITVKELSSYFNTLYHSSAQDYFTYQPKNIESITNIKKALQEVTFKETHQGESYQYFLRADKQTTIIKKIEHFFANKPPTGKDLDAFFKNLYQTAAGDYFTRKRISKPLRLIDETSLPKAIEILGKEKYTVIKSSIENILAGKITEDKIETLTNLYADGVRKVFYEPPYYLKKSLENLNKEELKWFRLKLGIPQKLSDDKWYELPTPQNVPPAFLYKNRPKGQNAIEWLLDPNKFGQFLKISGKIPQDILFQDQLRVLDKSGSVGLDNYAHIKGIKVKTILPPKEVRVQEEAQRLTSNKGLTIQKEGASLDKIKLKEKPSSF